MEDLLKLQYHLTQDKVEPALEMSKRGGHLWIFLATPLLAKECRIYIHDLALRLGVPVKGAGLADGIEVFPKHDAIGAGEFGNAIRGPLGIHRGANRRFWFYGADYTLESQITYLNGLRKVTEEELRRYIAGKERPAAVVSPAPDRNTLPRRRHGSGESDFRILAHVGAVRKVGRNYITRCPSCADAGHDRSGDNLAILIEDPRFYKCWAGCTKEMIRAALGYRRRTEKTATNIRVFLDAFVGEDGGKAHLVSVVGGDVEIGALAAAFANGDSFTVENPNGAESIVSLGEKPLCFRGSIVVPGRKRPLRHLVSCSQESADATSDGKLLLISDDQSFIWSSLVRHYGLPAIPEWGAWMISQLQQQKRIQPLLCFGYGGVIVKAKRKELLALLRRGLRSDKLPFPAQNGAVEWPEIQLIKKTA